MRFDRLKAITANLDRIQDHHILIFGLGGVGSFAAESIARSGFSQITLVDFDTVDETNLNRQLIALESTIGKAKVDVMKQRILDINPLCEVIINNKKVSTDNIESFFTTKVDFIIEAIDDLDAKIRIVTQAYQKNIPLIAAMGFANKFNPEMVKIAKLNQTSMCPLARKYRYELKKISETYNPTVVFSLEKPITSFIEGVSLGSTPFVPSVAGLMMGAYVFKYFQNEGENQ